MGTRPRQNSLALATDCADGGRPYAPLIHSAYTMIKPTVGRVVHFYPAATDALFREGEPLPLAATIVRVWSDTCVNLALFDGDAHLHRRTSVLLHQEGNALPDAGFAAWPAREGRTLHAKLDITSPAPTLQPIADDIVLEQQISEGGAAVAPRVTVHEIDALCASLVVSTHHFPGTTTTVAVAALPDGFVVATGHSACISPKNFKPHIGVQIASDNARTAARSKLWELEGYLLRASLQQPDALFAGGIMATTG